MKFQEHKVETSGDRLPFLKIKDGEKVVGVFKGEIFEYGFIWESKSIVPIGTKGSSFRFRVNFITKDESGHYVAKVMEQGSTVYNMLRDLNESYPLEETVVEIKRTGATKDDTRYSILPLHPKMQPNEKGWAIINQTPLENLGSMKTAKAQTEPAFDEHENNQEFGDELPF